MKDYCTQNNGDCPTCSLVNYGRDCQNNPVAKRGRPPKDTPTGVTLVVDADAHAGLSEYAAETGMTMRSAGTKAIKTFLAKKK